MRRGQPGVDPIRALTDLIVSATQVYRKGPAVVERPGVTEVFDMPPTPQRSVLVDVHFINVGFTEAAAIPPATLYGLIVDAGGEALFRPGPSYIAVGAWLGDQTLALCLFALGEHLRLWKVITPALFGVTGPEADQMAGVGYVMASGFPEAAPAGITP